MAGYITVLIIDDDPDDRELLIEAIREYDHRIICDELGGSIEAIKLLSAQQLVMPDYIFLDLNMPLMNGRECLLELRKIPHIEDSTVVVYTTSQREDDARELLEMGAVFFLIKPSVFSHLKDAIQYIFSGDQGEISEQGLLKKN